MKSVEYPVGDCPAVPVGPVSCPASSNDAPGRSVGRFAWGIGGFVCFGLGALGALLPILPTTPFLLLAAFCFARSSERLDAWFRGTALYKKVLEGYVQKRAMTVGAKLAIVVPATLTMGVGFALMANVPVGRVVLATVWVVHLIYFGFVVKTERAQ